MKTNNLLKAIALAIVMTPLYNCSIESVDDFSLTSDEIAIETEVQSANCQGTNPRARLINNGTVPFDYEIYDSTGAFISGIYGVMPGTVTDWTDFPEATIVFNVENGTDVDQKVAHLMENCTEINMEIDANNLLTGAVPQDASN